MVLDCVLVFTSCFWIIWCKLRGRGKRRGCVSRLYQNCLFYVKAHTTGLTSWSFAYLPCESDSTLLKRLKLTGKGQFSFQSQRKWSEVVQSRPTLCNPVDCSPPGSSIHGIFQARILEWVAISFSRESYQPRDRTQLSRTAGRCFTLWATREDFNPKERQCQRMLRLPHNCIHLTCEQSNAQNSPSQVSKVCELWNSRYSSWI